MPKSVYIALLINTENVLCFDTEIIEGSFDWNRPDMHLFSQLNNKKAKTPKRPNALAFQPK